MKQYYSQAFQSIILLSLCSSSFPSIPNPDWKVSSGSCVRSAVF